MQFDAKRFSHARAKNTGFTLVEMLVSVVVLSVGLLGVASLQVNSLRMNDSAYYRTQAINLGYDILERIRANPAQMLAGNYNVAEGFTPPSGTDVAAYDLNHWDDLLTGLLPNGQGSVNCDAVGICTVTVSWDDSRSATDTATDTDTKTITLNTQI